MWNVNLARNTQHILDVKTGTYNTTNLTLKYIGSVLQKDKGIEGNVYHRILAGWMK